MKIQEVEAFLAVLECGSFTAAAEKTFTAQPTLSWQVQQLEKEFGKKLFQRTKGSSRITLTKAGETFVPLAHAWVGLHEKTMATMCGNSASEFRFACTISIGSLFFPRLNAAFHAQAPDCGLHLKSMSTLDALPRFYRGEFDAALLCNHIPGDVAGMQIIPIAAEEQLLFSRCDSGYPAEITPNMLHTRNEIRLNWADSTMSWIERFSDKNERPYVDNAGFINFIDYFTFPEAWGIMPATLAQHAIARDKRFQISRIVPRPPKRRFVLALREPAPQPYANILLHELTCFFESFLYTELSDST